MENLKGGLELFYLGLSENSDATHRSEKQQEGWPNTRTVDALSVQTWRRNGAAERHLATDEQTRLTVDLFGADIKHSIFALKKGRQKGSIGHKVFFFCKKKNQTVTC